MVKRNIFLGKTIWNVKTSCERPKNGIIKQEDDLLDRETWKGRTSDDVEVRTESTINDSIDHACFKHRIPRGMHRLARIVTVNNDASTSYSWHDHCLM